jgi:hypothetical protein
MAVNKIQDPLHARRNENAPCPTWARFAPGDVMPNHQSAESCKSTVTRRMRRLWCHLTATTTSKPSSNATLIISTSDGNLSNTAVSVTRTPYPRTITSVKASSAQRSARLTP